MEGCLCSLWLCEIEQGPKWTEATATSPVLQFSVCGSLWLSCCFGADLLPPTVAGGPPSPPCGSTTLWAGLFDFFPFLPRHLIARLQLEEPNEATTKEESGRKRRAGCDSWHRLWFPCSPGAWKKHTTILQVGLPTPQPMNPRARWAPWKTGRSLNTVCFQKLAFSIYISRWKAAGVYTHWIEGGDGDEQVKGRVGRGSLVVQLVPKAALKSLPWTWREGGRAREVQEWDGRFLGKASDSHLLLQPAREGRGERVVSDRGTVRSFCLLGKSSIPLLPFQGLQTWLQNRLSWNWCAFCWLNSLSSVTWGKPSSPCPQPLPLSNCGFHFGQTNAPLALPAVQAVVCPSPFPPPPPVGSSELQSWAARALPQLSATPCLEHASRFFVAKRIHS
jgi:hypothetical protein